MVVSVWSDEKQLYSGKASKTAGVHSEGKRSKDEACVMVQMTGQFIHVKFKMPFRSLRDVETTFIGKREESS